MHVQGRAWQVQKRKPGKEKVGKSWHKEDVVQRVPAGYLKGRNHSPQGSQEMSQS